MHYFIFLLIFRQKKKIIFHGKIFKFYNFFFYKFDNKYPLYFYLLKSDNFRHSNITNEFFKN